MHCLDEAAFERGHGSLRSVCGREFVQNVPAQAKDRLALGAAYKDTDLVFALADGSPVTPWNFGSAFQDLIKRSGVTTISLHGLRDTHASLLAKAGVPIEVISQRLGHASIGITVERYLHVYKERGADAASAFERLVG